jgi:hypothetical protein
MYVVRRRKDDVIEQKAGGGHGWSGTTGGTEMDMGLGIGGMVEDGEGTRVMMVI